MNEELKHKIHSIYRQLMQEKKLKQAWDKVKANKVVERVLQNILWNMEIGYNYIYDCDIKGFFNNIPHKNLMKILNKYISDGSVLDIIW